MDADYEMIETEDALHLLVARLRNEPCIALDTEFVWERTFYARLGLVQIGIRSGSCFLLDPLGIGDLTALGEIMSDAKITKILHDAPQDLMILKRATNSAFRNIFDTRMAAGFSGLSSTISLLNLIAELFDVQLSKGQTRSNWLARPLASKQLAYAVDDVRYLIRVFDELRKKAKDSGVERWMDAELAILDDPNVYQEKAPEEQYRRLCAASSLSSRGVAVLRELAAWREETARAVDKPRRIIADDAELISMANTLPRRHGELRLCQKLDTRTVKRYGHDLVAAVNRGLDVPNGELPEKPRRPNVRRLGKERVNNVVEKIARRAKERRIDPQLVASKSAVAILLTEGRKASPENHSLIRGWRSELLGDMLDTLI
jgi:ribonuclease D